MLKGEITAFLSLIFVLLISFIMGVMQASEIQVQKSLSRMDTDAAIYSVFGEYQKELFEDYQIFAVEGSYGSGSFSEDNIVNRLDYYGTTGIIHQTEAIQYLTDNGGQAFREQVISYMEQRTGVDAVKDIVDMAEDWEIQEIEGEKVQGKEEAAVKNYEDLLAENEELPDLGEENPFGCMEQISNEGVLSMVLPSEFSLSGKSIDLSSQPSYRSLVSGWGHRFRQRRAI